MSAAAACASASSAETATIRLPVDERQPLHRGDPDAEAGEGARARGDREHVDRRELDARLGHDVEQRARQPLGMRARRVADALGAHAIVLDDRRAQRARRRVQRQYTHAIHYRICQRRRRRR